MRNPDCSEGNRECAAHQSPSQEECGGNGFFRALVESAFDVISVLNAQGIIEYESPAVEAVFGYKAEELVGRNGFELVHPEDRGRVLQIFQGGVSAPGATAVSQMRFQHKDGSWRSVEVRGKNLITDPAVRGIVLVTRDITERLAAEQALKASEAKYRQLIEQANDAIFFFDATGRMLLGNAQACKLLGCSEAELLSLRVEDTYPPEEADIAQVRREAIKECGGSRFERRFRRKDGSLVPVEVSLSLLEDGRTQGIFRDISERKKAEQKLEKERQFSEAIIRMLPGAFFLFPENGHMLRWNRNMEAVSGYTGEELAQVAPLELIAEADRPSVTQTIQECFEHGHASVEARLLTKAGRSIPFLFTGARVLLDGNRCLLGMGIDLTERKALETQVLRGQRLESIGRLAGGIAHDLNNILAPILMGTQLLRLRPWDNEAESLIEMIAGSANRGKEVVKQVLTFARGLSGEKQPVQPKPLVRELAQLIREIFPRDIHTEVEIPETPWTVLGDVTQLHQVLLNLSLNARDAMPHGGCLTLQARNEHLDAKASAAIGGLHAGPHVVLSVADTGAGIPSNVLDKIFDPFFTTKEQGKGTGLGLSTALGIVKSHGGAIHVSSQLGQGSVFRVYLPAAVAAPAGPPPTGPTPAPKGKGETILIIDDEAAVRTITQRTLTEMGYTVLLAEHGREALHRVQQYAGKIDLVLTDMMMPVMDGPATIRALHQLGVKFPIIAASGYTPNQSEELHTLGIHAFLEKPFTAEKLLQAVQSALAERQ